MKEVVGDVRALGERSTSARWGVRAAWWHEVEEAVPLSVGGEREEDSGAALGGKTCLKLLLLAAWRISTA